MIEPWTALGVSLLKDLVFQEILLELGKGALEDYVKDFIKTGITSAKPQVLKKALGEALQQFLRIVEDELIRCRLSGAEIRDGYEIRLGKFIRHQQVKPLLGQAFAQDSPAIEGEQLEAIWQEHYAPVMPSKFDWDGVAYLYTREVQRIIKQSPELRAILHLKILKDLQQDIQPLKQQTREIAGITPEFNLEVYQEGLKERYAHLNLDSLDTSIYDYREKLKVNQVFIPQNVRACQEFVPQAYEIPKEHQKRLWESDELAAEIDPQLWEQYKEIYYQQPIRSIAEVVKQMWGDFRYRYLVILGDPGSGKSMLLQYLALDWATTPPEKAIHLSIPLLIELRTYNRDRNSGECKDLLEFFHQGNVICRLNQHRLQEWLKAGKVLVMFDGLDEVFDPAQREQVITDIHRFTNDYPQVRVIVTSRIIGYKSQRLQNAEFRHFLLQDLDSEQIQKFIQRWHELTFIDEADKLRKQERLQRAIDTSKAIQELAGNPLLLTMMAILNRNQELPRDRPELYNQASRLLLHQWDVERKLLQDPRIDPVTIDYKDKQAMLRQIAHHMQAADKGLAGNLIRGSDLEKILTNYLKSIEVNNPRTVARLLIEQLRSRNFILCFLGGDSYGFVHRTFLEYFCAWEYVWQFKETQTLSIEQLITEVFGKHWQDESWHEVLRLIAGMIDAKFVGQIIEYLIEQKIDKRELTNEYRRRLRKKGVLNLLLAAYCFVEVRNKSALTLIATRLQAVLTKEAEQGHPYQLAPETGAAIITAIATIGQDNPQTLNWLKSCLQFDSSSYIPESAVQTIAQIWKDSPKTLNWLKQKAQSDESQLFVRVAAVKEIARGWKDNPDTLLLLQQWAQSDNDWSLRVAAVEEIARGWKDNPDTFPLLQQWAQSDNDWSLRVAVVEEIARGWKDDPDTLPLLQKWAQSDKNWRVRRAAVEKIARSWKDNSDTLPLLQKWAQSDKNWRVRYAAVEEIARGWKDNSDTLSLLKEKADNDSDEEVRIFARQKLEQLKKQSRIKN
ncbi:MAG: NACHT domain-containing protein [Symploca sp. SIO2D2]|nr:NACHT domain-containing protein [Symploca sp. SIO2D2]